MAINTWEDAIRECMRTYWEKYDDDYDAISTKPKKYTKKYFDDTLEKVVGKVEKEGKSK